MYRVLYKYNKRRYLDFETVVGKNDITSFDKEDKTGKYVTLFHQNE